MIESINIKKQLNQKQHTNLEQKVFNKNIDKFKNQQKEYI